MIGALLTALAPIVGGVIDRVLPDSAERDKLKAELHAQLLTNAAAIETAAASIIRAEAGSGHRLAAVWRPVTMLIFAAIVANNYIIAPYLAALAGWSVTLALPPEMWDLLKIGIGGYIVGRSGEKIARNWKGKG